MEKGSVVVIVLWFLYTEFALRGDFQWELATQVLDMVR